MKKPKTRRLIQSIKSINKQVRILRRGIVRRSQIVRYKEQERPRSSTEQIQERNEAQRPRSSTEQIQERNEAHMQQGARSIGCISVIAVSAIRQRWLRAFPADHSYRSADRTSRRSRPVKLQQLPANGKRTQSARRQSGRLLKKAVVYRLLQKPPTGKKRVKHPTINNKGNHRGKGKADAPRQRVTVPVASPVAIKVKQKGTIRQKHVLYRATQAIKSASSLQPVVGQARKEETSAHPQKQMVQTAMQARYSTQATRAVAQLNLRILKMLVRATALLVKGVAGLLGVSSSAIILMCVIMIIAALLSSPFAIFVADENTEPGTQQVSQIVAELDEQFLTQLEQERQAAGEVDRMELQYIGSADNSRIDNWPDVMAVFAVKTSMSSDGFDVATMDHQRIEMLQTVYWDMNEIDSHVEMLEHTEMVAVEQEDGSFEEHEITAYERVLYLSITARTAEQQASLYAFSVEQSELMDELLSAAFRPMMLALLGKDSDTGVSLVDLKAIRTDLPAGVLGSQAVEQALTRLGDPYSQLKAGQGNYTDCSYLVQWVYQQLEVSLPRTAAEQARVVVDNGLTLSADELTPGDLIFWSYEPNGRFMDITHVGIYAGNGKVIDASSSRLQVVYRNVFDAELQVMYGRPYVQ